MRPDGVDKVNGRAIYGGRRSAPAHAVRPCAAQPARARDHSQHRHLKARALPGVTAVVTNADFPRQGDTPIDVGEGEAATARWVLDNVLASDKALYRGHAVAAVAATDPHVAEDALELIEVEYELLEAVIDVQYAMKPEAPVIHETIVTDEVFGFFGSGGSERYGDRPSNVAKRIEFSGGDLDAGLAAADVVVQREFDTLMYHQGYIEPQNATALWSENGQVNIWTSTQAYFRVRDQVAKRLGYPVSKIRVNPVEIGGGFGGKTSVYMEPWPACYRVRAATGRSRCRWDAPRSSRVPAPPPARTSASASGRSATTRSRPSTGKAPTRPVRIRVPRSQQAPCAPPGRTSWTRSAASAGTSSSTSRACRRTARPAPRPRSGPSIP